MAEKNTNIGATNCALQYIRTIYLSLGAVIGLICFVMGASGAVKLGLNYWFPSSNYFMSYPAPYNSPCEQPVVQYTPDGKASSSTVHTKEEVDACKKQMEADQVKAEHNDFNRQIAESIALTAVGLPVWMLHFWLIQADWRRKSVVAKSSSSKKV